MRYFKVFDDVHIPDRWYPSEVEGVDDNWKLVIPGLYNGVEEENLEASVRFGGNETDYASGGYAGVKFISERARAVLLALGDIEGQLDFSRSVFEIKESQNPIM